MVAFLVTSLRSSFNYLLPTMPVLGKNYNFRELLRDLLAGSTVAAVLIPQSMAYALLAGLPPAHGLYAALLGGIAGSLWSNSKHLATGPIAILSLLTFSAVAPLAPAGSVTFIILVAALALMVGLVQISAGLLRLGFLVRLVPQSVLTGFSSAAALVIILTQIPQLFGFGVNSGDFVLLQVVKVFTNLTSSHVLTTILGLSTLLILTVSKKIGTRVPVPLLLLIFGVILAYFGSLSTEGVTLAGTIPTGFPEFTKISPTLFISLGFHSIVIAFVGFMSSYAVLKELAHKSGEKVDADKEIIAQGVANIFAGLFRGMPVGGSISRTAVNYSAGGVTAWSGIFASIFVIFSLLFLGPLLALVPNTILSAIVIFAVWPLIDLRQFKRLYEITRTDGIIALATFSAVFVMRPDEAILSGVILALVLYIRRVMWTDCVEVGIHPVWNTMHMREGFPEVAAYEGVMMLRIDAPLFYASIERLARDIEFKISTRERENAEIIDTLVLDFSGVTHIDVTGLHDFDELLLGLQQRNVTVYLIELKRDARAILGRGHLLEKLTILNNVFELTEVLARRVRAGGATKKHFV